MGPAAAAAPTLQCRTLVLPLLLLLLVSPSKSAACSAATLRIVYSADMSGTAFDACKLLRPSFLPVNDLLLAMGAPDMLLLLPILPVGVPQAAAAAAAAEGVHGQVCTLLQLLCRRVPGSAAVLLTLRPALPLLDLLR